MTTSQPIEIYTDGSCSKNPGPGGWGCIVMDGNKVAAYGYRCKETTNNRMELYGLLKAMEYAAARRSQRFSILSDSAYCVNMCSSWIFGWAQNGWTTKDKKPVKNLDLVQRVYQNLTDFPNFSITLVKGHAGVIGNELADAMATGNIERFTKICQQNKLKIIDCQYGEE